MSKDLSKGLKTLILAPDNCKRDLFKFRGPGQKIRSAVTESAVTQNWAVTSGLMSMGGTDYDLGYPIGWDKDIGLWTVTGGISRYRRIS